MSWIKWVTDDVSWAITVVGAVLIIYSIGSLVVLKTCDIQVVSVGITGIVALARGNGKQTPA